MSTMKHMDMTREQLLGELKKMEQRISDLEAPEEKALDMLEASRLAETNFRSLVEQSLFGAYIFQDGLFPYVSPKAAEILGWAPSYNLEDGLNSTVEWVREKKQFGKPGIYNI